MREQTVETACGLVIGISLYFNWSLGELVRVWDKGWDKF